LSAARCDAVRLGSSVARDLGSVDLWERSLARSRHRRRLAELGRRARRRRKSASLAISAGANVKVLQTLLGHKTATLTLDRYGHLFPDDLGKVADALDQMLWIRCFGSDALDQAAADWLRTGRVLHAVPSDRNLT